MRRLLFDLETDNLLRDVTKVHCMVVMDIDTEEVFTFTEDTMEQGLQFLYDEAEMLGGHNIVSFDLKVLKKLYNWDHRPGTKVLDTLVTARMMHPDLRKKDQDRPGFPADLIGRHSLRAWGIRIGEHKADYNGGWAEFTEEMLLYCVQDVKTNLHLLRHLKPEDYPQAPITLEQRVQNIVTEMEEQGFPFDLASAQELYSSLVTRRDTLEQSLTKRFGSWTEIARQFVAKRDNKPRGIVKGQTVTVYKEVVFNPGSRVHIERALRAAGWEPTEFTPTGRAKIDEEVLHDLKLPGTEEIVEYLLIQKRLGQLADGDNGWLRVVGDDGRIHCNYNIMGTVHSRASHSKPNIGQVPNAHALYGPECRKLFGPFKRGWKQVGADMSGAQLRCLAHYIAFWDKGKYVDVVTTGDIHTFHQEAASPHIKSRNDSKTTIYAYLYGAAAPKIGAINGGGANLGRKVMDALATKVVGLGALHKALEAACEKGWIKGLDGRRVPVAQKRLALNYLVTSAEAILCKTWLADAWDQLHAKGYRHGWDKDFVFMAWVHDEIQVACREEIAEDVANILTACAKLAGADYGFKCPLASDYKIGDNWMECH
jgi:DNA polymerase I